MIQGCTSKTKYAHVFFSSIFSCISFQNAIERNSMALMIGLLCHERTRNEIISSKFTFPSEHYLRQRKIKAITTMRVVRKMIQMIDEC